MAGIIFGSERSGNLFCAGSRQLAIGVLSAKKGGQSIWPPLEFVLYRFLRLRQTQL
jgi:hypothetical protein